MLTTSSHHNSTRNTHKRKSRNLISLLNLVAVVHVYNAKLTLLIYPCKFEHCTNNQSRTIIFLVMTVYLFDINPGRRSPFRCSGTRCGWMSQQFGSLNCVEIHLLFRRVLLLVLSHHERIHIKIRHSLKIEHPQ